MAAESRRMISLQKLNGKATKTGVSNSNLLGAGLVSRGPVKVQDQRLEFLSISHSQ